MLGDAVFARPRVVLYVGMRFTLLSMDSNGVWVVAEGGERVQGVWPICPLLRPSVCPCRVGGGNDDSMIFSRQRVVLDVYVWFGLLKTRVRRVQRGARPGRGDGGGASRPGTDTGVYRWVRCACWL